MWSPSVTPEIGVELTVQQKLACSFRILAANGFGENIAGHITVAYDDGSMWVNPWGLWWEEITASDVCRVSADAAVIEGRWDVTPAIHIHTELHRRRADARVVIHNHPYYATVLAAIGAAPEVFHQTGSMFDGDLGFVDEFSGEVVDAAHGAHLAAKIGAATAVLLANHGVIITGATIEEATYRAVSFQRMCQLAYDVIMTGRTPSVIAVHLRPGIKASLLERGTEVYWNGAVRQLLRRDTEVLG